MRRKGLFILIFIIIALVFGLIFRQKANAPDSSSGLSKGPNLQEIPGFNKKQYSLDEPSSPWVVVNKKRPLPKDFEPNDLANVGGGEQLRVSAAEALNNLLTDSKSRGIYLSVISGYRSYGRQISLYGGYVQKDGRSAADTYSARAGYSEHQTGLAIDLGSGVCDLQVCFADTPAGKWLADHSHEYGYVIRYQKDKESLTGYQYEPWHLRYVGKDLASELKKSNQTLEQFFDLPAAPDY